MFDLVTKTELKNELALLKVEFERDLHKLEAKLESKIGSHTLVIIGTVVGAAVALHLWR